MNEVQLHMKHSVFGNRNDVEYVTEGSAGIENTGIHPFIYNFCKIVPFHYKSIKLHFSFPLQKKFHVFSCYFSLFCFPEITSTFNSCWFLLEDIAADRL